MLKKWLPGLIGLSSLALLGRVAGFLREVLMASKFGASSTTDAYLTTIILFDLAIAANTSIISGTLSYLSGLNGSEKSFTKSLMRLSLFALLTVMLVAILLFPLVDWIIPWLFSYEHYATIIIIDSIKILLVLTSFVISCGILSSALQLKGKLSIPGGLTIFVNGFSIISLIFLSGSFGIISIPIGLLTGSILFFIFQYIITFQNNSPTNISAKISAVPWILSSLLVFGNLLLPNVIALFERYFALGMNEGTFSHYAYAGKLALLPLTIFGYAVSTSLLPIQTKYIQDNNHSEFEKITAYGLMISLISAGLLVTMIYIFAEPIVKIIYEHGHFSNSDTITTASTLQIYSLGLFPFLITPIVANIFYSLRLTKFLILAGLISMIANVLLMFVMVKIISGSQALATAAIISAWINLGISIWILSNKGNRIINRKIAVHGLMIIAITTVLSLCGYFLFTNFISQSEMNLMRSLELLIPTLFGIMIITSIYLVVVWLMIRKDFPELSILLKQVKNRIGG